MLTLFFTERTRLFVAERRPSPALAFASNKEQKSIDNLQVAYERAMSEEIKERPLSARGCVTKHVEQLSARVQTPEEDTVSYPERNSEVFTFI